MRRELRSFKLDVGAGKKLVILVVKLNLDPF